MRRAAYQFLLQLQSGPKVNVIKVGILMTDNRHENVDQPTSEGRRDFLRKAGKFAAVTPPAVAVLFSTSLEAKATAFSGGAAGPVWKGKHKHAHFRRKHKRAIYKFWKAYFH